MHLFKCQFLYNYVLEKHIEKQMKKKCGLFLKNKEKISVKVMINSFKP